MRSGPCACRGVFHLCIRNGTPQFAVSLSIFDNLFVPGPSGIPIGTTRLDVRDVPQIAPMIVRLEISAAVHIYGVYVAFYLSYPGLLTSGIALHGRQRG